MADAVSIATWPSPGRRTQETYEAIKDEFVCEPRGTVNVKGKGEMEVWLVLSKYE